MTPTTLLRVIESILMARPLNPEYAHNISEDNITTILQLIKTHPMFFQVVQSTLLRNIQDNQIRTEDVPSIISIISHLYHVLLVAEGSQKDDSATVEKCSEIIKFIFLIAIREDVVYIDNETDIILLLLSFDNIMDSCVKLLTPSKPYTVLAEFIPRKKKVHSTTVAVKQRRGFCCGCF